MTVHISMDQWASGHQCMKSYNPWLKRHENEEKNDNDHVLRNDHRFKTTQPISKILVSFFSEDNVLSDEIKICYFSNIKVTKIERSAFFGTPGIRFRLRACHAFVNTADSMGSRQAHILAPSNIRSTFLKWPKNGLIKTPYFKLIIFVYFYSEKIKPRIQKRMTFCQWCRWNYKFQLLSSFWANLYYNIYSVSLL